MQTPDKRHIDELLIRPAEPADALALSQLLGGVGVFEGTFQLPDVALATRTDMLAKVDASCIRLVAVDPNSGAIVATAGLHSVSPSLRRSYVRSLSMAVRSDWQGMGLGDALMRRITDWADNWAGVLRIELTAYADNSRAIALYKRHGFVPEGHMRHYALKAGQYADAVAMARLHPAPPSVSSSTAPV